MSNEERKDFMEYLKHRQGITNSNGTQMRRRNAPSRSGFWPEWGVPPQNPYV